MYHHLSTYFEHPLFGSHSAWCSSWVQRWIICACCIPSSSERRSKVKDSVIIAIIYISTRCNSTDYMPFYHLIIISRIPILIDRPTSGLLLTQKRETGVDWNVFYYSHLNQNKAQRRTFWLRLISVSQLWLQHPTCFIIPIISLKER